MKAICNGYNPWMDEPMLEDKILNLDGRKLAKLDIYIHDIESWDDVEKLISDLQVIKYCFNA